MLLLLIVCVIAFLSYRFLRPKRCSETNDVLNGLVTLHGAFEGLCVLGGPGSGKTSCVGREAFINLARLGAGFCVLAVKPDVYAQILQWAAAAGRLHDVIRFAPGCGMFDALNYELSQIGASIES